MEHLWIARFTATIELNARPMILDTAEVFHIAGEACEETKASEIAGITIKTFCWQRIMNSIQQLYGVGCYLFSRATGRRDYHLGRQKESIIVLVEYDRHLKYQQ
jgi:hypothetical protein